MVQGIELSLGATGSGGAISNDINSPGPGLSRSLQSSCDTMSVYTGSGYSSSVDENLVGYYAQDTTQTVNGKPVFYQTGYGAILYWTPVTTASSSVYGYTYPSSSYDYTSLRQQEEGEGQPEKQNETIKPPGTASSASEPVSLITVRLPEGADLQAFCTTGARVIAPMDGSFPAYALLDCAAHPVYATSYTWYAISCEDCDLEISSVYFLMYCATTSESWYYGDDRYGGTPSPIETRAPDATNSPNVEVELFPLIATSSPAAAADDDEATCDTVIVEYSDDDGEYTSTGQEVGGRYTYEHENGATLGWVDEYSWRERRNLRSSPRNPRRGRDNINHGRNLRSTAAAAAPKAAKTDESLARCTTGYWALTPSSAYNSTLIAPDCAMHPADITSVWFESWFFYSSSWFSSYTSYSVRSPPLYITCTATSLTSTSSSPSYNASPAEVDDDGTPPERSNDVGRDALVAIIVGVLVCAVLPISALVIACCCYRKRKAQRSADQQQQQRAAPQHETAGAVATTGTYAAAATTGGSGEASGIDKGPSDEEKDDVYRPEGWHDVAKDVPPHAEITRAEPDAAVPVAVSLAKASAPPEEVDDVSDAVVASTAEADATVGGDTLPEAAVPVAAGLAKASAPAPPEEVDKMSDPGVAPVAEADATVGSDTLPEAAVPVAASLAKSSAPAPPEEVDEVGDAVVAPVAEADATVGSDALPEAAVPVAASLAKSSAPAPLEEVDKVSDPGVASTAEVSTTVGSDVLPDAAVKTPAVESAELVQKSEISVPEGSEADGTGVITESVVQPVFTADDVQRSSAEEGVVGEGEGATTEDGLDDDHEGAEGRGGIDGEEKVAE